MHLEVSAPKRSVDSVVSSLSLWSHAREVRVIVSDDQPHASIGRPLSSRRVLRDSVVNLSRSRFHDVEVSARSARPQNGDATSGRLSNLLIS